MEFVLVVVLSYLIGSIPNGLIIGKMIKDVDLRQFGSKNIGATNAYRVLGPWPALGVLLTDAAKGVAGVYLGQALSLSPVAPLIGGIAAIAGHNWSVFLKFTGGRGVSTALGVIAVLMPKETAIIFLVWAVVVFATRYVSLGSILGAVIASPLVWLFGERIEYVVFVVVAALFVVIRHKPNIIRLWHGQELKIKYGGAPTTGKDEDKK